MKTFLCGLAIALSLFSAPPAKAGVFGDDLSRCLVASAGADEQRLLVKWIFASMSLHPDVAQYVSMPQQAREELDRGTADLFTRLLAVSCQKEATAAMKHESAAAVTAAFTLLGQVAAQGLFSDPAVAGGMENLMKHIDVDALNKALGGQETTP